MKKKIIIFISAILVCGLLSALIETFFFNFKPLTLSKENQYINNIEYTTKTSKDKTTLTLKLDNQYIRKLIINYESSDKVNYTIDYTYSDLYNKPAEESIDDIFEKSFSSSVTNIDQIVSGITISYDSEDITISQISIDNLFHFDWSRFLSVLLTLLTIFFLFYFYKTGFKTEKLHIYFGIISILLGTIFIIAQPNAIVYSWDDQTHFERIVTLFGGEIHYTNGEYNLSDTGLGISSGRDSINSIEEQQYQDNYLDTNTEYEYTTNVGHFTTYSKIPYSPMAIGYHGAKLFKLPFSLCFKIGKFFNLLVYVLLMAYAIKTLLVSKRLLTLIALFPTIIFLASNYSYDPAVFAGISVFLAHIINLITNKNTKVNFKTIAIMIAAISYACLAKAVYIPLLLLVFLIPKTKFKNAKQSRLVKIGFASIMLIFIAFIAFPLLAGNTASDPRGGDTSTKDQLLTIINHPLDYTVVLKNNMLDEFFTKLIGPNTIGSFAYMGDISKIPNLYYILIALLFTVFLTDNKNNNLTKKQRWITFASIFAIIFLIWNALYLSFTPVGSKSINGVQGRYFLPLLFPFLLLLQPKNIQNKINDKLYNSIVISAPTIITIILIFSLILAPHSF